MSRDSKGVAPTYSRLMKTSAPGTSLVTRSTIGGGGGGGSGSGGGGAGRGAGRGRGGGASATSASGSGSAGGGGGASTGAARSTSTGGVRSVDTSRYVAPAASTRAISAYSHRRLGGAGS